MDRPRSLSPTIAARPILFIQLQVQPARGRHQDSSISYLKKQIMLLYGKCTLDEGEGVFVKSPFVFLLAAALLSSSVGTRTHAAATEQAKHDFSACSSSSSWGSSSWKTLRSTSISEESVRRSSQALRTNSSSRGASQTHGSAHKELADLHTSSTSVDDGSTCGGGVRRTGGRQECRHLVTTEVWPRAGQSQPGRISFLRRRSDSARRRLSAEVRVFCPRFKKNDSDNSSYGGVIV